MITGSEQQSKRAHEVISERRQGVICDIAVGGAQHVDHVASARAEALSHAEVVFEDLDGSRRNMLGALKKICGNGECEWFETSISIAEVFYFGWQGRVEKSFGKMKAE